MSYQDNVINSKHSRAYDIYIGRGPGGKLSDELGSPGYWGNPIKLEKDTPLERKRVILKYWAWLTTTDDGLERLMHVYMLKGKKLGCWCAPDLCHGHVLSLLANDGYAATKAKIDKTREWVMDNENKEN